MLVTLSFVFSPTIPVTRLAPFITESINRPPGLKLSIEGEVSIKLGLDTQILLEGLNLWDEKAADHPFLSMGKTTLSLDFLSVLNGPVNIQQVVLSDVALNVVHLGDMKFNIPDIDLLELMKWLDNNIADIPPFTAHDMKLKHVLISISDLENDLSGQWLLEEVDASWGWESPLTLFSEGGFLGKSSKILNSKPITISATADSMRHFGDKSLLWNSAFHLAANESDMSLKLALEPTKIVEPSLIDTKDYLRGYALDVKVKQFQYGGLLSDIDEVFKLDLATKLDTEGELRGHLGTDVSLTGQVNDLADPLLKSSGVIEVFVWPQDQNAHEIDFWAANLVNMAFKVKDADSIVNCAVARFNLSEGVLNSEVLVFDTSRLRVYGEGSFDLSNNYIDFLITPKTKQLHWVDKTIPIRLKGTLDEPKGEVKKTGLLISTAKSVVNFVIPILPLLINDTMKNDGSKECLKSMDESSKDLKSVH